jgi:hypothetical protein
MATYTPGFSAFKIAFELSPILLTGGIAQQMVGFAIPIMALTEAVNFPFSMLSTAQDFNLDRFFAHYQVLPGSTLVNQDIAQYPFANATIAANAVITKPINVSLLMICPIQNKLGWTEKLAIMTGLKYVLDQHNLLGGTYTILTPGFTYINCVMKGMHDASSQLTKQVQNTYQLDFEKPLLTQSDVTSVLNGVANAIKTGAGAVENVFGINPVVSNLSSILAPTIIPSSSQQAATAIAAGGTASP